MTLTKTEKFIAYFALISGLTLSAVAEYYSILGLIAIFSAAVIPIVIMGVALGAGKISATLWLKQNWETSPKHIKGYLFTAIVVLMLITSMGIFGFLSKAHNDQTLVSGDVQSKIAIYDEKIKTEKENIDANRKALKQMDEGVDQVLGRSTSETGANRAMDLRRSQQKERSRLQAEILQSQKRITEFNEARAPIAAEVRKVEAEVGPIKYIAKFIYGDNGADENFLERAVTWIIIILIVVFDPLAVSLLLASQYSFAEFRRREQEEENTPDPYVADVGEKPTEEELEETTEGDSPEKEPDVVSTATVTTSIEEETPIPIDQWNKMIEEAERAVAEEKGQDRPYLWTSHTVKPYTPPEVVEEPEQPVAPPQIPPGGIRIEEPPKIVTVDWTKIPPDAEYITVNGQTVNVKAARQMYPQTPLEELKESNTYVQNEEQSESGIWQQITEAKTLTEEEYIARSNENKNK